MSTQSVPRQFPVPLNLPGHASARRGPVPVDRAHGLAVPKVGLSEICLSYRTQSGERLLALEGINLDVRAGEMRMLFAIARALATESDVLLMYEPFAALDAQTRDLLHDELERIWSNTGRTIIFVTHNVREAVRLGDRVVLLTFRPGRVKSEFPINLPRPRSLEDPTVALAAREVLDELRDEINRSLEAEYNEGVKPHVEPGVTV